MDSAFSTLSFVIFGATLSFYAFVVQSQIQDVTNAQSSFLVSPFPPPPPPPPPPLSPPLPPTVPGSPNPPRSRRPWPPRGDVPIDQSIDSPPPRKRRHRRHINPPPPPPPPPKGMNPGKKVGILFAGMAGIMQIGFVTFLIIKRRQLIKANDRYESHS